MQQDDQYQMQAGYLSEVRRMKFLTLSWKRPREHGCLTIAPTLRPLRIFLPAMWVGTGLLSRLKYGRLIMKSKPPDQESERQSDSRFKRRRLLKTALAVTGGASLNSLLSVNAFAAERSPGEASGSPPSTSSQSRMDLMMQDAIKACSNCHAMCLRTAMGYCLERGGRHVQQEHLRSILNCAELCQTSANFMLSGSPLHGRVCAVCAEVCDACAKSCEQVGDMSECADECRACAKSCRTMT